MSSFAPILRQVGTPRLILVAIALIGAIAAIAPAASKASDGSSATQCAGELSNPFLPWGDTEPYRLAPGGDFEGSTDDWTFSGDAELVDDSGPLGGASALSLGRKASALSAPICLDGSESFSRMFARSEDTKGRFSLVKVEAVMPSGRDIPVGVLHSGDEWDATDRFLVPRWWALMGIDSFQYRFTAIGNGTTVLDDLYVDPRRRN